MKGLSIAIFFGLLTSNLVEGQISESHQKGRQLPRRVLESLISEKHTDQSDRNELLQKISLASASWGHVDLASLVVEKLNAESEGTLSLLAEVSMRFAEFGNSDSTLHFIDSVTSNKETKNQLLADAVSVFSRNRDFTSANKCLRQIKDESLLRMATIEVAFLSNDKKASVTAILNGTGLSDQVTASIGTVEVQWVVNQIAILKWAGEEDVANSYIEKLNSRDASLNAEELVENQLKLLRKIGNADENSKKLPDTFTEAGIVKELSALLEISNRKKEQSLKMLELLDVLADAKKVNEREKTIKGDTDDKRGRSQ